MTSVQIAAPNFPSPQIDASASSANRGETIQPDAAVGQVILKLGALPAGHWCAVEPSSKAIAAMQQLMAVVEQIRSPTSGWQPDQPQTPDQLLPYVSEEACNLLDALEASLGLPAPTLLKTVDSSDLGIGWEHYGLVEQLVSPALWAIARSAYLVMRLLEGVVATVGMGEAGDRTVGVLRLAAVLQIETPLSVQSYDLVLGQGRRSPPSKAVQIYSLADGLLAQATSADDLMQHLKRQLRFSTPHLAPFLDGINVNVLTPGQPWQGGTLQLQLGFDFVAAPLAPRPLMQLAQISAPCLTLTDVNWLATYRSLVHQQQLSHLMPQLAGCHTITRSSLPLPADQVLPLLVQDAYDALELLTNPLSGSTYLNLQGTLQFGGLIGHLLWRMSRSTPALMTLMGGVRCALLQPELSWEQGLIRLLVSLKIKTPGQDWFYDLATGELPEPSVFPLAPNVILQMERCAWCPHPTVLQDIETQLLQQIETAAPELRLLLAGTDIDWLDASGELQPATLQLQIDFDFMPI
jgi:hypothetical protein